MTPLTFVRGIGEVATLYGVEESVLLDAVVFWVRENRSKKENFRDGRWWTYNSIHGLEEMFPWWTGKQIRRIINSCRDKGALLVSNYNKEGRDRTMWYSPSDELLKLYGEDWSSDVPICPNGQMHLPKRADPFAQMGTPLPCNNHVYNTPLPPKGGRRARKRHEPREMPDWNPERFNGLWSFYPKKGRKDKQAAMDAWDKLKPDDDLINTIARALVKLKASDEWSRGIGIPYVATFLNGARWKDAEELDGSAMIPPERSRWAEDEEVL